MAEKSAQNLIDAIEKSKKQPFERVIYALGIRFVGRTVAKDLANAFKTMEKLQSRTEEELAETDAIGPRIAASVVDFFSNEKNKAIVTHLGEKGLQFEQVEKELASHIFEGKKFVLTGSLPTYNRNVAKALIEKHGGKTTSSVSKNTDYVLAGESASSKLDKANELGIKVLDEPEFRKMIEE
jgi:DNA ligase (NAD+)